MYPKFRRWAVTPGVVGFVASPTVRQRPHPLYRWLRQIDPVHKSPFGVWVLSRHADVVAALRHPDLGNDEAKVDLEPLRRAMAITGALRRRGGARAAGGPFATVLGQMMLFRDPPDHTRLRSLVARAFTPRRVEALEGRVEAILEELLEGPARRGRIELMSELAYPLPARVICELLGVDKEDEPVVVAHAPALAAGLDPLPMRSAEAVAAANAATTQLTALLDELIAHRQRTPRDDLVSALIEAEQDGYRLSHDELVATLGLVLIAGHETTANLIGNAIVALLGQPEQFERLRAEPGLDRTAVEEFLRHDGPIHMVNRVSLSSVTIGGETIPPGRFVVPLIAAANRDPGVFADPERLDIARDPNPHVGFGGGAHFCIGASLARLEGRIAIPTLVRRFPQMQLAARPTRRPSFTIRGYRSVEMNLR